jgi:hypothetical protein
MRLLHSLSCLIIILLNSLKRVRQDRSFAMTRLPAGWGEGRKAGSKTSIQLEFYSGLSALSPFYQQPPSLRVRQLPELFVNQFINIFVVQLEDEAIS